MIETYSKIKALYDPKDHKFWYILLLLSLISGLFRSLFLAFTNSAIEQYGNNQPYLNYLFLLVFLLAGSILSTYYLTIKNKTISTQMLIKSRINLLKKINQTNLQFIEQTGISNLHYHIIQTLWIISTSYNTLLTFVAASITLIFNFIYIGWLSPIGLLLAIAISLFGILIHFKQEKLNTQNRIKMENTANMIHQNHLTFLQGYKELSLSEEKTKHFFSIIDLPNQENLKATYQESKFSALANLNASLFQYITLLSIVFILPVFIETNSTTILQLVTAILFTIAPLEQIVHSFPDLSHASVALKNYQELQKTLTLFLEKADKQSTKKLSQFQKISLQDIIFYYDDHDNFTLGPINMDINRGEIIFITGGNGAGKSVLLKVLTGLYHQKQGHFIYNGKQLAENQRQVYREQFATVFNDFYLFDELLFNHNYSDAQINQLIKHFDLEGKTQFKAGKFSNIELSTGQRKRLALISAIIEDKPILVLDEFAAEQDPQHREAFYYQWLPELKQQGKTLVVVSHDQQYFSCADRVIQMDLGEIVNSQVTTN